MRFSYPAINNVFDTDETYINTLVIENRALFCEMIQDIHNQICGFNGKASLAENGNLLDFSKFADLTVSLVPFEVNRKPLLTKVLYALEKKSQSAEYYEKTMQMLTYIEKYIDELAVDFSCDLNYNKLSIPAILKSVGIEVYDDGICIAEKMLNYMVLVREFDRDRLFIIVNMRSYIDEASVKSFMDTLLSHKYHCIMFESTSYSRLDNEKRYTVDEDLCEL